MNRHNTLPTLPAWHARSFYATLLTAVTVSCNIFGFGFLSFLSNLGLGETEPEVLDNIELLMPVLFALWAWFERINPSFHLTLWKRK